MDKYKLKTNPFRLTPQLSSSDLIWAGFPELKEKISKRIQRSVKIPNSSLILNWGEYGSGKTHAARYFNREDILNELADDSKQPFSLEIIFPKGKQPVKDIYISIIDKLDITELREKFITVESFKNYINLITTNKHIQSILHALFLETKQFQEVSNGMQQIIHYNEDRIYIDPNLLKKYLYGTISNSELKELGLLRMLNTDNDYSEFLAALFSCLTYNKEIYSSVIVWIDEFEDIAILNSVNIGSANNFFKILLDKTPDNLLIFLNVTQSAMFREEDLGEYLHDALRTRLKDRIEFKIPEYDDLILYLKELLKNYRTEDYNGTELFPFNEALIHRIIQDIDAASLRRFNEAFSLLLELAEFEDENEINIGFYENNINEINGWKE